tara:strand:+ start:375 stop:581 length:207 start_codon:yes stop_codon:yes gene_type:complete
MKKITNNEQAIKSCQDVFENFNESERLIHANKFIKFMVSKGGTVNSAIGFLSDANVLSDTELAHCTTF